MIIHKVKLHRYRLSSIQITRPVHIIEVEPGTNWSLSAIKPKIHLQCDQPVGHKTTIFQKMREI